MTAETPTSRFSRLLSATLFAKRSLQRRGSFVSMLALIVFAIAASSTFFVISTRSASMQDPPGTAEATPSAEDLADVREQAIEDEVDQLELEFVEFNDSGVEGTVTLYDLEAFTLLAILIEEGGDVHPAHIHEGTCDDLEPQPFAPLTNVTNEEASLSLVDTPLDELLEGDYSVDLHLSPNELGTMIVCAEIEGVPAPATPAPDATPGTPNAVGGLGETPEPTAAPATETPEPTATSAPTQPPTPTEVPPTLAAVDTPAPTAEPTQSLDDITEDGTGGPEAAPDSIASLPLMDFSALGVTGTISLIALDDQSTRVTIRLAGDAVTGGHIAHVHPGDCDDPQDEGTIYLSSVDMDGSSDTTVNLPLFTLLNEGWSVNVHLSDTAYDTWLVCGYLGDATLGMSGVQDIGPDDVGGAVTGKGDAGVGIDGTSGADVPGKGAALDGADGTSGLGGTGDDRTTTVLTQRAGIGSTVDWPESPAQSISWALGIFALVLATSAVIIRRAERHDRQSPRWIRLGL